MKTTNLILKVVVGAFLAFAVTACSKDKKSNNNGYWGYGYNGWSYVGGVCRHQSGQVDPTGQNCMQAGIGQWQIINGVCQNISTGQIDHTGQACMFNNGGIPGGMPGGMYGQCVGWYRSPQTGETGQCYPSNGFGNNCSGWYLCNVQTGYCQMCQ